MLCNVYLRVNADVHLRPYDEVKVLKGDRKGETLTISKMIETKRGVKAVFTDGTWRPISTYGTTWQ